MSITGRFYSKPNKQLNQTKSKEFMTLLGISKQTQNFLEVPEGTFRSKSFSQPAFSHCVNNGPTIITIIIIITLFL